MLDITQWWSSYLRFMSICLLISDKSLAIYYSNVRQPYARLGLKSITSHCYIQRWARFEKNWVRLSASPVRIVRFAHPLQWPKNLCPLTAYPLRFKKRLDVFTANFDVFKGNLMLLRLYKLLLTTTWSSLATVMVN